MHAAVPFALIALSVSPPAQDGLLAPDLEVRIDPRVELFTVVFRLAGHREYSQARIVAHAQAVDRHFDSVRDHAVVRMARELRARRGISYDACMSLAVHVGEPPALAERIPLDPMPAELDPRWTTADARAFLDALRDFVRQSRFQAFLEESRSLLELARDRFETLLEGQAHLEWFAEFFGQRPGSRLITTTALLNGPSNYGVRCRLPDGSEEVYGILGAWQVDPEGRPTYGTASLETFVHECCHSYVNPIVDRHLAALEPGASKLYETVAPIMQRQAYGSWPTMTREYLVRACTLRYVRRHQGALAAFRRTLEEQARGFRDIAALVALLDSYETGRDRYPTFESFMPEFVAFLESRSKPLAEPVRP